MNKIKNFVLTTKDFEKVMNRGCRICKNNNFRYLRSKQTAICTNPNCQTRYYYASEGLLDFYNQPYTEFTVYRFSDMMDCPGEIYEIQTAKTSYARKKEFVSKK